MYINNLIKLKKTDKRILIYGAGYVTKAIYPHLKDQIIGIVDKDTSITNTKIGNTNIDFVSEISNFSFDYILITPISHQKEIINYLSEEYNIQKSKILTSDFSLSLSKRNLVPKKQINSDLFIVEFPKSGITWFSHIFLNCFLIELKTPFNATIFNLEQFIGDIHKTNEIERSTLLPYRIIKSHDFFNPNYRHTIYILRNPFSVMESYYFFKINRGEFKGDFSIFIKDEEFGITSWVTHVESWLENSKNQQLLHLIKYEDLLDNSYSIIQTLMTNIGFSVSKTTLNKSIEISNFENMKKADKLYRENCPSRNYNFVRKGKKIAIMKEEDQIYIFNKTKHLLKKYYKDIYTNIKSKKYN